MDYALTFFHTGKVATYIPELAKGDPDRLGTCIITDGDFLAMTRKLCRRDTIHLNGAVFQSEKRAGMRNRSMA